MPILFVSHASKDDIQANALEEWLRDNGFTDIFIDHHSIAGGDRWRDELRASAGACRVVICLVTESWLASDECFGEFAAASYMHGKRIIPLFLLPPLSDLSEVATKRLARICAEDQGINLDPCLAADRRLNLDRDETVAARLRAGLRAAGANSDVGLDPEAFAIDRTLRPTPFPGLDSFGDDDGDAALFYGRSREIAEALEDLREMRAKRDSRPFVILGASGAGKSSLLKAGIIPRLRREVPAWLPLRAFRPGADPLLNFAEALARTYADFGKIEAQGAIRDRLFTAWRNGERDTAGALTDAGRSAIEHLLSAEGQKLRQAAGRDGASILISVDQAEEIARAEGDSGDALADYLRVALAVMESAWQLACTTRTDSFPELQNHRRFQNLTARGYDLRALPAFRFGTIIEGPAKRYGLKVDPLLIDRLMGDAPKEDVLPLLAFSLQRLWRQYAASGALTKDNYDNVGGLKGLIENAAERAMRGIEPGEDTPLPSGAPAKRVNALGAATFVPALVHINEQGAIIRRIADWASFDEQQQELLGCFDRWRLVVRKGSAEAGRGTVEVAHEALFREWPRLSSWLEPERARLDALRALEVDAATWRRNDKDRAFLNHREKRLAEADALATIERYRQRLSKVELDYLGDCRRAERLAGRRTRRIRVALGTLATVVVLSFVGWRNDAYLRNVVQWYWKIQPYMRTHVLPYVLTADAERALKPGNSFRECDDDCPEMVVIPPGIFIMGSPEDETGHGWNEEPRHNVTFARPFAVSKFEVTVAEWRPCLLLGGCPSILDGGFEDGAVPAINVTWLEARQYVEWLSKMTGKTYRLLSEAEWEYAARAGTQAAYSWGNEVGKGNANCNGCGSQWDNRARPAPVGSFAANAFGVHDMHGNVSEWIEDCGLQEGYWNAPAEGSAKTGLCGSRAVRGGSWSDNPSALRSASRRSFPSTSRFNYLGFRVARTLGP